MKNIIYFVILLLSPSISLVHAQDWSGDVQWLYFQSNISPTPYIDYRRIKKIGTDSIQGKECHIFEESYEYIHNGEHTILTGYPFMLSYENNIISYYDSIQQVFHTIYDFNLEEGDTLHSYCAFFDTTIQSEIIAVEEMIIGDDTLKKFIIKDLYEFNMGCSLVSGSNVIIEGIGTTEYLFPFLGFADPPPGGNLACFQTDDFIYPDTLNACELLVAVDNIISDTNVKLFPNPTEDILTIEVDDFNKIQLYNTVGKLLLTSTQKQIDLSSFASGVYWVKLKIANSWTIRKIIKL